MWEWMQQDEWVKKERKQHVASFTDSLADRETKTER